MKIFNDNHDSLKIIMYEKAKAGDLKWFRDFWESSGAGKKKDVFNVYSYGEKKKTLFHILVDHDQTKLVEWLTENTDIDAYMPDADYVVASKYSRSKKMEELTDSRRLNALSYQRFLRDMSENEKRLGKTSAGYRECMGGAGLDRESLEKAESSQDLSDDVFCTNIKLITIPIHVWYVMRKDSHDNLRRHNGDLAQDLIERLNMDFNARNEDVNSSMQEAYRDIAGVSANINFHIAAETFHENNTIRDLPVFYDLDTLQNILHKAGDEKIGPMRKDRMHIIIHDQLDATVSALAPVPQFGGSPFGYVLIKLNSLPVKTTPHHNNNTAMGKNVRESRLIVHEMSHALGLVHPFTTDQHGNCFSDLGEHTDVPPTRNPSEKTACSLGKNHRTVAYVNNILDYNPSRWRLAFTVDQVRMMYYTIEHVPCYLRDIAKIERIPPNQPYRRVESNWSKNRISPRLFVFHHGPIIVEIIKGTFASSFPMEAMRGIKEFAEKRGYSFRDPRRSDGSYAVWFDEVHARLQAARAADFPAFASLFQQPLHRCEQQLHQQLEGMVYGGSDCEKTNEALGQRFGKDTVPVIWRNMTRGFLFHLTDLCKNMNLSFPSDFTRGTDLLDTGFHLPLCFLHLQRNAALPERLNDRSLDYDPECIEIDRWITRHLAQDLLATHMPLLENCGDENDMEARLRRHRIVETLFMRPELQTLIKKWLFGNDFSIDQPSSDYDAKVHRRRIEAWRQRLARHLHRGILSCGRTWTDAAGRLSSTRSIKNDAAGSARLGKPVKMLIYYMEHAYPRHTLMQLVAETILSTPPHEWRALWRDNAYLHSLYWNGGEHNHQRRPQQSSQMMVSSSTTDRETETKAERAWKRNLAEAIDFSNSNSNSDDDATTTTTQSQHMIVYNIDPSFLQNETPREKYARLAQNCDADHVKDFFLDIREINVSYSARQKYYRKIFTSWPLILAVVLLIVVLIAAIIISILKGKRKQYK